jgi:subtilisin family serine protease
MNIRSTAAKNGLVLLLTVGAMGLLGAGCSSAPIDDDDLLDESVDEAEQALDQEAPPPQNDNLKPDHPCPGCAPPFVDQPGKLEFSGRLIVRPRQNAPETRKQAARARIHGMVVKHFPEVDEYVIRVPDAAGGNGKGAKENQLAGELMASGDYEYATPDWNVAPIAIPNDPSFGSQWHHTKIESQKAWDLQRGSSSMILAFTDTGIDTTHPDLAANRVPGYHAPSGLAETSGGPINDIHGHGTHVAGCAAAIGNNGTGVSGVGWNFKIMMVRVTDDPYGYASISHLTQGARWAAEHGAKVVSTSYAGVQSPSVGTTGTYIKSIGSLYLYAADNFNQNHSSFDYPDVIVVGATDQYDAKASFSSYGTAIDMVAPGVGILSTTNGGWYAAWDGTSMATPVVNGAAGLIWSVNPNFTPAQVEGFLLNSANDIGAPGDDSVFGRGRLNVYNGVQAARAAACTHAKCSVGAALGSGCDTCTASICDLDPYCCDTYWDNICVNEVQSICGSLTCAASQGTCGHTLCTTGATLTSGCDTPPAESSCVTSICAVDPYCCNTYWDGICVSEVQSVCGKNCN